MQPPGSDDATMPSSPYKKANWCHPSRPRLFCTPSLSTTTTKQCQTTASTTIFNMVGVRGSYCVTPGIPVTLFRSIPLCALTSATCTNISVGCGGLEDPRHIPPGFPVIFPCPRCHTPCVGPYILRARPPPSWLITAGAVWP